MSGFSAYKHVQICARSWSNTAVQGRIADRQVTLLAAAQLRAGSIFKEMSAMFGEAAPISAGATKAISEPFGESVGVRFGKSGSGKSFTSLLFKSNR